MTRPIFEQCIDQINNEINKRKGKWNLTVLAWLDFEDVAQILRIHIYKKWEKYDPAKPLAPWLNTIISNQIKNLIRNTYGNYCRPCLKCAAMEGEDGCRIYVKQCNDCPFYAKWEKNKKSAHDTKLPVSLESHQQEVFDMAQSNIDIERTADNIHSKMEKLLKPFEWRVYKGLYIDNLTEQQVAEQMNYRTSEIGRPKGYKHLRNIKKTIITKVKKLLADGGVDLCY